MIRIEPGNATLGARVTGVELARSLPDADFASVLQALAQYGVLCFPNQPIEAAALRAFSARFGGLQAMSSSGITSVRGIARWRITRLKNTG